MQFERTTRRGRGRRRRLRNPLVQGGEIPRRMSYFAVRMVALRPTSGLLLVKVTVYEIERISLATIFPFFFASPDYRS